MSRGKYSPAPLGDGPYDRNAYGEVPPEHPGADLYDTKIHFGNYDERGFDSYGYSAWYKDGTYADIGSGVDAFGHTEDEYLCNFTDDEFCDMPGSLTLTVITDRGPVGSLNS